MSADVASFLSAYRSRIIALRTTSRPAIVSLTMIAQENSTVAPQITNLISEVILKLPPAARLPLIYLMDSIMKNDATRQYSSCFARHVSEIVLTTNLDAAPKMRESLVRLVTTWRDAKLFSTDLLSDLTSRMKFKDSPAANTRKRSRESNQIDISPRKGTYAPPLPPPRDLHTMRDHDVRSIEERGVSERLNSLMYAERRGNRTSSSNSHSVETTHNAAGAPINDRPFFGDDGVCNSPDLTPRGGPVGRMNPRGWRAPPARRRMVCEEEPDSLFRFLEGETRMQPMLRPLFERVCSLRMRGQDFSAPLDELTDSIRSIREHSSHHIQLRGYGPSSRTRTQAMIQSQSMQPCVNYARPIRLNGARPQMCPTSNRSVVTDTDKQHGRVNDSLEMLKMLNQVSAALDKTQVSAAQAVTPVKPQANFSSAALKKTEMTAVDLLYNNTVFDTQCEYCALRMAHDTLSEHLDWHFKINREQKKREKESASQLWFMNEDEWVRCSGDDEREAAPSFIEVQQKQAHDNEEKRKLEQVALATVPVDDEQTNCHSCGEAFERFWDDPKESWLYRDAMYLAIGDERKIVHQSCHDGDAVSSLLLPPPPPPQVSTTLS